jgi:hypothetical protein
MSRVLHCRAGRPADRLAWRGTASTAAAREWFEARRPAAGNRARRRGHPGADRGRRADPGAERGRRRNASCLVARGRWRARRRPWRAMAAQSPELGDTEVPRVLSTWWRCADGSEPSACLPSRVHPRRRASGRCADRHTGSHARLTRSRTAGTARTRRGGELSAVDGYVAIARNGSSLLGAPGRSVLRLRHSGAAPRSTLNVWQAVRVRAWGGGGAPAPRDGLTTNDGGRDRNDRSLPHLRTGAALRNGATPTPSP